MLFWLLLSEKVTVTQLCVMAPSLLQVVVPSQDHMMWLSQKCPNECIGQQGNKLMCSFAVLLEKQ